MRGTPIRAPEAKLTASSIALAEGHVGEDGASLMVCTQAPAVPAVDAPRICGVVSLERVRDVFRLNRRWSRATTGMQMN